MARCRSDRRRTSSWCFAATVVAALLAAAPAAAAPPVFQRTLTLGNGASYTGWGQGGAVPSSPLILGLTAASAGATADDARRCLAGTLDPAKTTGKIVVCDNELSSPADKSLTVANAGGVAMILVNLQPGPRTAANLNVQTVHVKQTEGLATKTYANGTATPTASMNGGVQTFVASTTAVVASPRPSTAGLPVTFTATVGNDDFLDPAGNVSFVGGGLPIAGCEDVAVVAGKAKCTITPLTEGTHAIAANYSGDDGLAPSAATMTHRVDPPATAPVGPPPSLEPAVSDLELRSSCVRPARSGRVRVAMTMHLVLSGALQIQVERGVGSKGRRRCPSREGARPTRFRPVTTLDRRASAGDRRLRLRLRLRPGMYRVTVRALLPDESLSRPARGFVRVLKR